MKIVSVGYTRSAGFSDPEKWLERINFYTGLLEELAKEHQVASIECIDHEGEYEKDGVRYYFIGQPKNSNRLIRELKPDIVLVNGFIFPLQIIRLRRKLGRSAKIFVLHRSERPFRGVKRIVQKIANRHVDAYLFASAEFGKEWKGVIDQQKIHEVIQASSSFHAGDKDRARKDLSVPGSPVFLWVGGLNTNKDPLTLIKAFKQYLSVQPRAMLYIIYQSNELINECKELIGTNEHIKLVGKIEHRQLQTWYNAADFFISTSHSEGNGIAAVEAMSCGCIPILSDIVSFRRKTGPGKCGLLFQPGNADELFNALIRSGEMDMQAEKEKVLQQFREELSFAAIAGKINKIIDRIS